MSITEDDELLDWCLQDDVVESEVESDWCSEYEEDEDSYPPMEVSIVTDHMNEDCSKKVATQQSKVDTIEDHLESFNCVSDKALEWSSKKPYLQDLFAGWLEGDDLETQSKLLRDTKRKWWNGTQSADMVRSELSHAVFGAVAIAVNGPTNKGWTAKRMREPTFPLTLLLQNGADPSAMSDSGPDGGTALHWLADMAPHDEKDGPELRERHVTLGRILLDHGADVNARMGENMDRATPLHKACSSRAGVNIPFLDLLLQHGANVNALTMEGWTFLMYSVPFNINGAWHIINAAEEKLNNQIFIYEIEEALVEDRIEYLRLTYNLSQEITSMLVMILGDLREELEEQQKDRQQQATASALITA